MEEKNFKEVSDLFKSYKQMVEDGKYDSHDQMITLYYALIKRLHPGDIALIKEIREEIEAHECDQITDMM